MVHADGLVIFIMEFQLYLLPEECNKCTVLCPLLRHTYHTYMEVVHHALQQYVSIYKKILVIINVCFSFTNITWTVVIVTPCGMVKCTKTLLFFFLRIIAGSGALRKKSAFLSEYLIFWIYWSRSWMMYEIIVSVDIQKFKYLQWKNARFNYRYINDIIQSYWWT